MLEYLDRKDLVVFVIYVYIFTFYYNRPQSDTSFLKLNLVMCINIVLPKFLSNNKLVINFRKTTKELSL